MPKCTCVNGSRHCRALTAWEFVVCTGGSVIHTAHYPNERHSHHILRRRKLCDHWSPASSGSQFKTCQSRFWPTWPYTLVTEASLYWLSLSHHNVSKWLWTVTLTRCGSWLLFSYWQFKSDKWFYCVLGLMRKLFSSIKWSKGNR